jgi:hypothetical protein
MKNVLLAVVTAIGLSSCLSFDLRLGPQGRIDAVLGCARMEELGVEGDATDQTAVLALDQDCDRCCRVAETLSARGARLSYWLAVSPAADTDVDAEVERTRDLLAGLPTAERVYLPDPRSVDLVETIRGLSPASEVVPVFVYEASDLDALDSPRWIEPAAALANSGSRIGVGVRSDNALGIGRTFDRFRSDLSGRGVAPLASDRFVVVLEMPVYAEGGIELSWPDFFQAFEIGVDDWVFVLDSIEARPAPLAQP